MKKTVFTALFCLLSLNLTAQPDNEISQIQETFKQYNQAIMEKNGEKASTFVTNSTFENYEQNRKLALEGTKEAILAKSLADQMQILIMRHKIDTQTLQNMSGKSLFAYTISDGWVEKKGIKIQKLSEIQVQDKHARAKILFSKKDLGAELQFIKSKENWQLDLTSLNTFVTKGLEYAKSLQSSQSHEDFLKKIVKLALGHTLKKPLWDLPQ